MDADQVLRLELQGRGIESVSELDDHDVVRLGLSYAIWLPRESFIHSPWLAPFAVRKIRIRTDPNAPGPARDLWGFPDSLGRFTDDNSLIKGVVRGRRAVGRWSPYGDAKLATGLVCCHVWPNTTGDPSLFSFVPNLVWLPRSLAGYSDAHFTKKEAHPLHFALRIVSASRYAQVRPLVGRAQTDDAWSKLETPAATTDTGEGTEVSDGARVAASAAARTQRVLRFLDDLASGDLPRRRLSRRYHAGIGSRIDTTLPAVQSFVAESDLTALAESLRSATS